MNVSIIIPTYNSEDTLEACLQSIRNNKTFKSYEIIVCDSGSTDSTLEIAHKYADNVINAQPQRINRNIGLQNAKGKIILFTDSDCLVPCDWIDKLVDTLTIYSQKYYKVAGVGGGNVAWLENPTKAEVSIAKVMTSPFVAFKARNTANYKHDIEVQHNPPINSAYFKYVLDKVGGFIEQQNFPEDLDLDTRLIEKGYHLYYLSNVVVQHKHKKTYDLFEKQMRNFGRKRIAINRKHKIVSRWYHIVPAILCVFLHSPLFFIPYGLALLNSIWKHDLGVFILTLKFYYAYGKGEIDELAHK